VKMSGVYAIVQRSTQARYIGSSKNITSRVSSHWRSLRIGKHSNSAVQEAYDAKGRGDFYFLVLEECPIEKLREREQHWLDRTENRFNVVDVVDPNSNRINEYCSTDAAFARSRQRVQDRALFIDWAFTEITNEWNAADRPFWDRFDAGKNFLLKKQFESEVLIRAAEITTRQRA
jgi:group I intron endonuclease